MYHCYRPLVIFLCGCHQHSGTYHSVWQVFVCLSDKFPPPFHLTTVWWHPSLLHCFWSVSQPKIPSMLGTSENHLGPILVYMLDAQKLPSQLLKHCFYSDNSVWACIVMQENHAIWQEAPLLVLNGMPWPPRSCTVQFCIVCCALWHELNQKEPCRAKKEDFTFGRIIDFLSHFKHPQKVLKCCNWYETYVEQSQRTTEVKRPWIGVERWLEWVYAQTVFTFWMTFVHVVL